MGRTYLLGTRGRRDGYWVLIAGNCFRQMGWVEDLGSGIRNMYKYCPIYVRGADKILVLIAENPKITANEIGNILSLSENYVRKILARLVNLSLIERRGSDKVGEWHVIQG